MVDASGGSVVSAEVALFDGLAARWWDRLGPMAPLHAMNPARVAWVDGQVRQGFGRPVRLLDVGCGGGLAAEALARLGHEVTGIDAAPEVIAVARAHAEGQGLRLVYRHATAEALAAAGEGFEAITSLEVIEHVADPASFLAVLAGMLEPGGVLCLSTLNRTRRSWVVAKLGAEYVLRLLPAGTHAWSQFITPAELAGMLRRVGLLVQDVRGLNFSPISGAWRAGGDTKVNYLMAARKV
jgi:2-polyprenyl-6-hydroxyphenyl methylase/3-demethylubiquinone-9 3-methyltransferase